MVSRNPSLAFVAMINAHDLDGLVRLMASDYVFIDSLGEVHSRPGIEEGWRQYFEMVPDYWIKVERTVREGNTVILVGRAGGTFVPNRGVARPENAWETPAVWVARTRGGKVAEWRVYSDNEPIRQRMRRNKQRS